jgi:hypothetical protein
MVLRYFIKKTGKTYSDSFLASNAKTAPTTVIAFNFQMLKSHDRKQTEVNLNHHIYTTSTLDGFAC